MRLSQQGRAAVLSWWRELHPDAEREWNRSGDSAARAQLRRCHSPGEALLIEPTHALIRKVHAATGQTWPQSGVARNRLMERLALLAVLLATVRPPERASRQSFVAALGLTADGRVPAEGERPRLSRSRFGALLRAADEPERFLRLLRRASAVLAGTPFDLPKFVDDLICFDDRTRREWTLAYYQPYGLSPLSDAEATAEPSPENAR